MLNFTTMGNMCGKTTGSDESLKNPLLDDDSLGGEILAPKQPFDGAKADTAAIQPSVSAQRIITSDGSILIEKSGPIEAVIQNGESRVGLRALYFENKKDDLKSVYIVRNISYCGSVEYRMLLAKNIRKSNKLCNYAEFLNGEMNAVDFKQSLSQNIPKYHMMLWNILTDGRVSARLYK